MSKMRDKFAMGAMQSLLSAYGGDISPQQVGIVAYMVADEMLKARTAPPIVAAPKPEPVPAPKPEPLAPPRCEQGPHPDDVGPLANTPRSLGGLTPRVLNALDRRGVRTIGALTRLSVADLTSYRFKGIGLASVAKIRDALAAKGLTLAGEAA